MVQGELFTEESPETRSNQISSFFSKNQLIIGYDKLILLSIVFLVLFILTYSFGYERGYKGAEKKMQSLTAHIETLIPEAPAQATTNNETTTSETIQIDANAQNELEAISSDASAQIAETQEPKLVPQGKYTIQIKTVLSKDGAEKEVAKLSAKTGALKPFYIKRGRFFEVCAGAFETVANAKPILNEFKTKNISSDAFVRPLA